MLKMNLKRLCVSFCHLGVGTIVAVDELLNKQQKTDLAKRFLAEAAGAQAPLSCVLCVQKHRLSK